MRGASRDLAAIEKAEMKLIASGRREKLGGGGFVSLSFYFPLSVASLSLPFVFAFSSPQPQLESLHA